MGQLSLDGYMDVQYFIFQPGRLFAHFLFGPGRQIALLSAKAVQYNYHNQFWEKRLARYFSWQWRVQAHSENYLRPYRVVSLLETVGEEVSEHHPSRTRERLEKALDTLQADQVIGAWQYDRWQEDIAEDKGWINFWLQATLLVEPPEAIKQSYQSIVEMQQTRLGKNELGRGNRTSPGTKASNKNAGKRSNKKASSGPPDEQTETRLKPPDGVLLGAVAPAAQTQQPGLSELVKRKRVEFGLSQLEVAQELGVNRSYLSKLEHNILNPSPEMQAAIEKWLLKYSLNN